MIDNSDGRRWARFTLALALLLSMAGNALHTVLADSEISLWLRMPPALLWPVFTFLGIEVLVRIIWERRASHKVARALVLIPAVPAAIVSYQHLYSLLLLMGEEEFIALIGPAAIDGAMIGMTMVLLFTRRIAPQAAPAPIEIDVDEVLARHGVGQEELPIPVSPAPAPAPQIERTERAPRASRAVEWDVRQVAEMSADGAKAAEISAAAGISSAVAYRYTKLAKTLRANPAAEIDAMAEKVRPEAVRIMRELIAR